MAIPGGLGMLLGMAGINPEELAATAKSVGEKVQQMADMITAIGNMVNTQGKRLEEQAATLAVLERKLSSIAAQLERDHVQAKPMTLDEYSSRRLAVPLQAVARALAAPAEPKANGSAVELDFGV